MSKFSVKISDIQKEHKPKYYVSTWDMSSIRAKEKYRLYKNDVHNLRKFERSEQRLRTVELYSNNQNFGYGQKFLINLVRNGTERMAVRNKATWKAELRRMHCPLKMKDTGDPSYRLGVLYATGDTVKKDDKHAKSLFLAAAEIGNPKAQCALGELYEDGHQWCTKRDLFLLLGQWKCYIPNQ